MKYKLTKGLPRVQSYGLADLQCLQGRGWLNADVLDLGMM